MIKCFQFIHNIS